MTFSSLTLLSKIASVHLEKHSAAAEMYELSVEDFGVIGPTILILQASNDQDAVVEWGGSLG